MNDVGERRNWFDRAEKIGRLDNYSSDIISNRALQCFLIKGSIRAIRNLFHAKPGVLRVSLQHIAIFGMQGAANQERGAPGHALRHQHSLSGGSRAIPHGSVGDLLSRELAHERLKLEDRLQCALCDLRLIRRVRGEKLAALDNGIGDH